MIDIVMPVHGSEEMVQQAIKSIVDNTNNSNFTLMVVCDHDDETFKSLVQLEDFYRSPCFSIYKNGGDRGFASTCNYGASKGSSSLILFLNSDIVVEDPTWLDEIEKAFDDDKVGIVGSKLLFFEKRHVGFTLKRARIRPPGRVQHAGVAFEILNRPYHIFVGWESTHPKVNRQLRMNAVTGACLATRRDLFNKIGRFSLEYTLGNFEDIEYCLRVRAEGYDVVYTPRSVLYHLAGGSGNSITAKANEQIFLRRCKDLLVYDEYHYVFGDGL